jgi:hypothetical protein
MDMCILDIYILFWGWEAQEEITSMGQEAKSTGYWKGKEPKSQ